MTSSNGNIFRVTGHLCGEFTGPRWIPRTKASDAELWCFFLFCVWINDWVNNREAGDLRRYRTHYDVIVMGRARNQALGPGDILYYNRLFSREYPVPQYSKSLVLVSQCLPLVALPWMEFQISKFIMVHLSLFFLMSVQSPIDTAFTKTVQILMWSYLSSEKVR